MHSFGSVQSFGTLDCCKQLTHAPPTVWTSKLSLLHTQFVSEPQAEVSSIKGWHIVLQPPVALELRLRRLALEREPARAKRVREERILEIRKEWMRLAQIIDYTEEKYGPRRGRKGL